MINPAKKRIKILVIGKKTRFFYTKASELLIVDGDLRFRSGLNRPDCPKSQIKKEFFSAMC